MSESQPHNKPTGHVGHRTSSTWETALLSQVGKGEGACLRGRSQNSYKGQCARGVLYKGLCLPLLPRPLVLIPEGSCVFPREGASEHNHLGHGKHLDFRGSHTHMLALGLLFTSGVILRKQPVL